MSDFTVIDIETTGDLPWRNRLLAVGLGQRVYNGEQGRGMAAMAMSRRGTTLVAHTNYDLRWLMLDGLRLAEGVNYHDTKVMAWMLDGTQALDLESLSAKYLDHLPPKPIKMQNGRVMFESREGLVPIEDVPWYEMEDYNRSDITTEARLYVELRQQLQDQGLWDHFVREEAPFSRLLVECEVAGVPYSKRDGAKLLAATEESRAEVKARLVEATGIPDFNPGSGDQVAAFLYGELFEREVRFAIPRLAGLKPGAKAAVVAGLTPPGVTVTKIGRDYATGTMVVEGRGLAPPKSRKNEAKSRPTVSAKKLKTLYGSDPWVRDYIEMQRCTKLIGYLNDWQEREHDGRLHGRLDQAGTITGRLAGREPNMQQISGQARTLFAGDLVIGDYGGLEARLAAHFSMDPVMLDIYREGKDLYGVMAARAWGGAEDKSNPGRGLMKLLWLASQYGAQGETLANTLAVAGMTGYTARKADALLGDLESAVPRLFKWREEVIAESHQLGYVETLAGRRRALPNLQSAEWKIMAKAERQAVSTKVQGSAADVVRLAMLECRKAIRPEIVQQLLQVHDEILWERGPEYSSDVVPLLQDICENVYDLEVPLVFEIGEAQSWGDKGGTNTQAVAEAVAALEA